MRIGIGTHIAIGGGRPWTPLELGSSLWSWHEARNTSASKSSDVGAVCTDGAACGYVRDLSGNGRHWREGAWIGRSDSYRPTWNAGSGVPYWAFSGSTGFVDTIADLDGPKTVITAYKLDATPSGTYNTLWALGSTGARNTHCALANLGGYNSITVRSDGGTSATAGINPALDTNKQILSVVCNRDMFDNGYRTGHQIYLGGVQYPMLDGNGFVYVTDGAVGANINGGAPGNGINGRIYARIVADGILNDAEIGIIEQYLAGVIASTATAHSKPIVVCVGDSLTYGQEVTGEYSYPAVINPYLDSTCEIVNLGIPGYLATNLSSEVSTRPAESIVPGRTNAIVVWIGSNNLGGGTTGAALHTAVTALVTAYRNAGFGKVAVCTVLPRTLGTDVAGFETRRQDFRALVVPGLGGDSCGADAVVDLGGNTTIGEAGDQNNTTYYNADKVHLTAAGYDIVAQEVATALNAWI